MFAALTPHTSHAGGSHTSGRTDCGKLMSQNIRARGPQVHSNEEVE